MERSAQQLGPRVYPPYIRRSSQPPASPTVRSDASWKRGALKFACAPTSCVQPLLMPVKKPSEESISGVTVPVGPNRFAGVQPAIGVADVPHPGVVVLLSCVEPNALAVSPLFTDP